VGCIDDIHHFEVAGRCKGPTVGHIVPVVDILLGRVEKTVPLVHSPL